MKMNNMAIINFTNIFQNYMDKKLPQKISYAIMRNFTVLSEEYKLYSNQYQKLIDEFADKIEKDQDDEFKFDNNGFPIMKNSEDLQLFKEPLEELLNIEVDVDMYTISESDLIYDDSDRYDALSPSDTYNLKILLCEAKDKEE